MKANELPVAVLNALSTFSVVELHLRRSTNKEDGAENFTTKFGKRIKAAGGTYSAMRGDSDTRYVKLPANQTALINEIMRWEATGHDGSVLVNRQVVMIARQRGTTLPHPWRIVHESEPAWISVHKWSPNHGHSATAHLADQVRGAVIQAIDREIIKLGFDSPTSPVAPVNPMKTLLNEVAELLYEAEGVMTEHGDLMKKLQGFRNGKLAEAVKAL